jgi:hypothetical protein
MSSRPLVSYQEVFRLMLFNLGSAKQSHSHGGSKAFSLKMLVIELDTRQ